MHSRGKERETVLVADDEECLRTLIQIYLEQNGYKVLVAANGDEALAVAREFEGQISLLVTDMRMPGMEGRDLSKAFLRLYPEVQVLFITAGSSREVLRHQPDARVLAKPFDLSELSDAVRELLICCA